MTAMNNLECNERYYVPSEITWMLKSPGTRSVDTMGCEIGGWDRAKPLMADHFEMLVVARK